jgi:hypothetical protein
MLHENRSLSGDLPARYYRRLDSMSLSSHLTIQNQRYTFLQLPCLIDDDGALSFKESLMMLIFCKIGI